MLLSTFELLFKNITPSSPSNNFNRMILQGYFLNIANPNDLTFLIELRFNAITPDIVPNNLLIIQDTIGVNATGNLNAGGSFNFVLRARDTGLIILQPEPPTVNNTPPALEVRGYVEIFVRAVLSDPSFVPNSTYPFLVTPEHRGTFLLPNVQNLPPNTMEFDQLITSLPTSTGGALIDVDVISNSSPNTIGSASTRDEGRN